MAAETAVVFEKDSSVAGDKENIESFLKPGVVASQRTECEKTAESAVVFEKGSSAGDKETIQSFLKPGVVANQTTECEKMTAESAVVFERGSPAGDKETIERFLADPESRMYFDLKTLAPIASIIPKNTQVQMYENGCWYSGRVLGSVETEGRPHLRCSWNVPGWSRYSKEWYPTDLFRPKLNPLLPAQKSPSPKKSRRQVRTRGSVQPPAFIPDDRCLEESNSLCSLIYTGGQSWCVMQNDFFLRRMKLIRMNDSDSTATVVTVPYDSIQDIQKAYNAKEICGIDANVQLFDRSNLLHETLTTYDRDSSYKKGDVEKILEAQRVKLVTSKKEGPKKNSVERQDASFSSNQEDTEMMGDAEIHSGIAAAVLSQKEAEKNVDHGPKNDERGNLKGSEEPEHVPGHSDIAEKIPRKKESKCTQRNTDVENLSVSGKSAVEEADDSDSRQNNQKAPTGQHRGGNVAPDKSNSEKNLNRENVAAENNDNKKPGGPDAPGRQKQTGKVNKPKGCNFEPARAKQGVSAGKTTIAPLIALNPTDVHHEEWKTMYGCVTTFKDRMSTLQATQNTCDARIIALQSSQNAIAASLATLQSDQNELNASQARFAQKTENLLTEILLQVKGERAEKEKQQTWNQEDLAKEEPIKKEEVTEDNNSVENLLLSVKKSRRIFRDQSPNYWTGSVKKARKDRRKPIKSKLKK